MGIYNIAVLRDLNGLYSYSCDDVLRVGQLVIVNFRNSCIMGVVAEAGGSMFTGKIKKIDSVLPYTIPEQYVAFAQFVSGYYFSRLGSILKSIIPFSIELMLSPEKGVGSTNVVTARDVSLNHEQESAVKRLVEFKDTFKVSLLHGITGSGKTEVYLEFLRGIVDRQILILIPEIALSKELAKSVSDRLGIEVFIWHHSISKAKKLAVWRKAVLGERIVVIGARSAIFIPFSNLGAIVVDEEHDVSFKQDEGHIYNARDMAVYLGYLLDIPVILSSATPSMESYSHAKNGKYEYVRLASRFFKDASLPMVTLHDLRNDKAYGSLSKYSISKIQECLDSNKQALVFVNRRGHTPKVLCRSCGWKVECNTCSAWLCYHHSTDELVCHYCGYKTSPPSCCHECGKESLIGIGTGIEKVFHECTALFRGANILVLSSDTMDTPNKISKAIERIKKNEVDIIIGTQLIAKGHNFDNLNTVIVMCADALLYGDDFRATERAFQMIQQVSGRAGRTDSRGAEVVIQTYNPDDELVQYLKHNDFDGLYEMELRNRQTVGMPPFGKMVSIILSSISEKAISSFANMLVHAAPKSQGIKILGPIQPPIYKIRSRYRQRIVVLSDRSLHEYISRWQESWNVPSSVKLVVDVDPYNFM
ncbi:MAG: primosomal protein N' [Holosporales bacterium]|jgi:primosomal protein N' (replication factor Y)|nr:primosomal protein N' [Holosporales bacterium]